MLRCRLESGVQKIHSTQLMTRVIWGLRGVKVQAIIQGVQKTHSTQLMTRVIWGLRGVKVQARIQEVQKAPPLTH